MIDSVLVSNFRSLGPNTRLDLGRMTALVGPNGVGKTRSIESLEFIADALRLGLEGAVTKRQGISAIRRWSPTKPFDISIKVELSERGDSRNPDWRATYALELTGADDYHVKSETAEVRLLTDGSVTASHSFAVTEGEFVGPDRITPSVDPRGLVLPLLAADERFARLARSLIAVRTYRVFPDTLRRPQKFDPQTPMEEHGENWASTLKRLGKSVWDPEMVPALRRLTGDIDGLRVQPAAGFLIVEFRHGSEPPAAGRKTPKERWFSSDLESDGTLRVAGILTALLQEPPLALVAIEEPELTVHPGALRILFDFLREASKHSQVVVTTHSPEMLDCFSTEDIRRVTKRDRVTFVEALDDGHRSGVKRGLLSTGDLLRSSGLPTGVAEEP